MSLTMLLQDTLEIPRTLTISNLYNNIMLSDRIQYFNKEND